MARRRIRTVTLSLAGVVAGSVATTAPADADDVTTVQHNICGNVCGPAGAGNLGKAQELTGFIQEHNLTPLQIGINESCGTIVDAASQRGFVKSFLRNRQALYWGAEHTQTIQGDLCNTNNDAVPFGIATFVLSSDNPYPGRVASGPFDYQVSGDEARGWVCINGGINTPKYWGCTAHMNNTNPGSSVTGAPAERQFADYYADVIRPRAATKTTYWGGDLYTFVNEMPNIPIDGNPQFTFAANREADLCQAGTNTYRWTHRNKNSGVLSKFDYTFRSGPGAGTCATDALLAPGSSNEMYPVGAFGSDHRIVAGYQPLP